MNKGKMQYKDFKDLKSQNPIPVVKVSVPGPGLAMKHDAPAWVSGTSYAKKSLVSLEGHTYRSKIDGNKDTPSSSAIDWTLLK
jgi:hypothetical protein